MAGAMEGKPTIRVWVLNGPNLNLLGVREPEIYGRETLADLDRLCHSAGAEAGLTISCRQTNAEHEMIGWIQEARGAADGIVINPAAHSHTSIAIRDALSAFDGPKIEVHLSNIHAREPFRHHSHVSAVVSSVIAGCGADGYRFAIARIARLLGHGGDP